MSKIQAILFDCDGVLLDTEREIKKEIHQWLKKYDNYNISYDEFYKKTRGQSITDTIKFLNSINVQADENFFKRFDEYFIENYNRLAVKMENVEETLTSLSHLPKAVCSNGLISLYTETLHKHGIRDYFDAFFGLETTKNLKPHPDMFLQAAETLEVPIENCLVIDDSSLTGVPGGKASNAGVVVGFLSDEFSEKEHMINAGADYTITNLNELPEIVNKINEGKL